MMTPEREKVARLRGLMYGLKFAIEQKEWSELSEMVVEIDETLDFTKDGENETLAGEWKPGHVFTGIRFEHLAVGQVWEWVWNEDRLRLEVVAMAADGEVQLRHADAESLATAEKLWPAYAVKNKDGSPKTKNGKQVFARPGPFLWVMPEDARPPHKGNDFLCHEAWVVWVSMTRKK